MNDPYNDLVESHNELADKLDRVKKAIDKPKYFKFDCPHCEFEFDRWLRNIIEEFDK